MELLGLAVEICLLLVLLYAVVIGTRIGKNFSDLKKGEREMRSLFVHFKDVIERAENTMQQAKLETQENHDELAKLFKDADQLRSDLEYMLDRSKAISERMEDNIRKADNIDKNHIATAAQNATTQQAINDPAFFQSPNMSPHNISKPTIKRQAFTPPNDDISMIEKPKYKQDNAQVNNKVNLLKAIEGMG